MKKLKTLKDLIKEADKLSFGGYTTDTLKEEAIKWIKHLTSDNFYDSEAPDDLMFSGAPSTMISWIKHFFNITDEDLK